MLLLQPSWLAPRLHLYLVLIELRGTATDRPTDGKFSLQRRGGAHERDCEIDTRLYLNSTIFLLLAACPGVFKLSERNGLTTRRVLRELRHCGGILYKRSHYRGEGRVATYYRPIETHEVR